MITLPAAGVASGVRDAFGTAPTRTPVRAPAARARVLLIEDEPALARALAEQIGRVHDVVVAEGALKALELLEAGRYDAVLCDLRMPGMAGDTLYARVREVSADQAKRFVFMTGVGFGADVERFLAQADRPVLEKPFSGDDALAAISAVMGGPR